MSASDQHPEPVVGTPEPDYSGYGTRQQMREEIVRLQEQYGTLHAAATELADFLWHEKETREPPSGLLDAGYAALETSADYEREEQLGQKLLIALGRDPNEVSSPAKERP